MTPVSSPQNPLLKKVRQAVESGRALENGCMIAEGPHLVGEALHSRWRVRHVLTTPESLVRFPALFAQIALNTGIEITEVAARAFQTIAATEHSQGILALLEPRAWRWRDLTESGAPLVILDGVQDPGNAGTIIRSAEAFGAGGAVFTQGSVRVANPKLLRAAAGSIFRVPFLEAVTVEEIIRELRLTGTTLYALAASAETSLLSAHLENRFALIVGSEGAGVGPELMVEAQSLFIPTANVESLNAAVACSIALFEAVRQRSPL